MWRSSSKEEILGKWSRPPGEIRVQARRGGTSRERWGPACARCMDSRRTCREAEAEHTVRQDTSLGNVRVRAIIKNPTPQRIEAETPRPGREGRHNYLYSTFTTATLFCPLQNIPFLLVHRHRPLQSATPQQLGSTPQASTPRIRVPTPNTRLCFPPSHPSLAPT